MIVSEEIAAPINKYIDQDVIKQSIIHFIPPHCKHHLVTNKDSKMRLHYNLNQESSRLPVQLLDEGFIRSVEPGKATIVVEGKSFEHQEVFINVIVVPVYSLALEKPYVPLSIPLGSETKINIILQENNGRSFM